MTALRRIASLNRDLAQNAKAQASLHAELAQAYDDLEAERRGKRVRRARRRPELPPPEKGESTERATRALLNKGIPV